VFTNIVHTGTVCAAPSVSAWTLTSVVIQSGAVVADRSTRYHTKSYLGHPGFVVDCPTSPLVQGFVM